MVSVLIISTNETQSIHVLRCLSIMRTRIHVMGVSRYSPIRLSRYCNNYIRVEKQNLIKGNEDTVNDINNYCKQNKIDIVIPVGIDATLFISEIRDRITGSHVFPLTDIETLKMLNNKWTFTEFMNQNNIPCPKTVLIEDNCQIGLLNLEFPVIIKALELEGKNGVVKLESFKELEVYMDNGNKFNKLPLIIQEYIPGIDMGINVLAKDGKIIAWNIESGKQKYQQNGNIRDVVEFFKNENILNIGRQIVSCCNYTGIANFDMKLDGRDKSIKVLECNPRFWSTLEISTLSGINYPYLGILLSQKVKLPKHINYKEIRYLKPKALMLETLRNVSMKDVNKHNLYFLREIILDPLFYIYIQCFYFFSGLSDKLRQWRNRI